MPLNQALAVKGMLLTDIV